MIRMLQIVSFKIVVPVLCHMLHCFARIFFERFCFARNEVGFSPFSFVAVLGILISHYMNTYVTRLVLHDGML